MFCPADFSSSTSSLACQKNRLGLIVVPKDRDQSCPFASAVRHRRHQGIVQHLAPIGSHYKCRNWVCEKHENHPLEDVRDLVILEPDCSP